MGLFSCRPRTTHGRARCARTALGPTEARRRVASSDVRPFALVSRPRSTSATGELAALLSASGAAGATSAVLSMGISPVTLFRRSAQWALAGCFTLGQDGGRIRARRQYPQRAVPGRKQSIGGSAAIGSTSVATTVVSSKEGYDAMTDWQTQSCKTLKGINQPITGALSQPITGALSDPFPDTGTSSPECGLVPSTMRTGWSTTRTTRTVPTTVSIASSRTKCPHTPLSIWGVAWAS